MDHEQKAAGRPGLHLSVLWNMGGQVLPLAAGLLAMPFLVEGYGTEGFGLLALAWILVGYASILDMGLSRALTQAVAAELATPTSSAASAALVARTALAIILAFGLVVGVILALVGPGLGADALALSDARRDEAHTAFLAVALSVPVLVLSQGLRGILEAHQRFDLVNAARIPLGVLSFVGPVLLLLFTNSVVPAVLLLIATRMAAGLFYAERCRVLVPALLEGASVAPGRIPDLLRFGGWMSVSNVVAPLLVHFDRFLIGAVISVSATAYYAVPFDTVTRLSVLAGGLAGVMFPAFALADQEPARLRFLFERGTIYIFVMAVPMTALLFVFAPEILDLWLGPEFASESAAVMRILCLGVMINSVALIAHALLQGRGRADLTAKFHLIETPFYLAFLWWAVGRFGIEGAAAAWTLRVTADCALLSWGARLVAPLSTAYLLRGASALTAAAAAIAVLAAPADPVLRLVAAAAALVAFAFAFRATLAMALDGLLPEGARRRILAGLRR